MKLIPEYLNELIHTRNVGKVAYLGLTFMILYSGFLGVQNLMALVISGLGYTNLGFIGMIFSYFIVGITSIFTPKWANILKPRYTFAISCAAYFCFMVFCVLIALCGNYGTLTGICSESNLTIGMIFVSAIYGLGAAVMGVAQGAYVNECADRHNKGRLFGLFGSLQGMGQVFGNFGANWLYKEFGSIGIFLVMTIVLFVAMVMFLFTPDSRSELNKDNLLNMELELEAIEADNYVKSIVSNEINDSRDLMNTTTNPNTNAKNSNWSTLKEMMLFLSGKKFLEFFPFYFACSYNIAIRVALLAILAQNTISDLPFKAQAEKLGYVMLAMGIAAMSAGNILGNLCDKNKKLASIVIYSIHLGSFVFTCLAYVTNTFWLFLPTGACYGFIEGGWPTFSNSFLGLKFKEKFTPYAAQRCMYQILLALFILLNMFLMKYSIMVILLIYLGLLTYGYHEVGKIIAY